MKPLVSVVIPAYQAQKTIGQAITSVVMQTHAQLQILVVVDAAKDETYTIAKEYSQIDSRINIIFSKKNRGVVRCRNIGMRLSKGKYIAFCDADDVWETKKIEKQLEKLITGRANICYGAFKYIGSELEWESKLVPLPKRLKIQRLYMSNPIALSSALLDKESLGLHYFESLPQPYIHEDYAYWIKLFKLPQTKAVLESNSTTYIRQQPGSRSSNKILAAQSQYYILRNIAKLNKPKSYFYILTYFTIGLYKRGWNILK
jgi:glycosyltransferase involved in cell wall biosynthesis